MPTSRLMNIEKSIQQLEYFIDSYHTRLHRMGTKTQTKLNWVIDDINFTPKQNEKGEKRKVTSPLIELLNAGEMETNTDTMDPEIKTIYDKLDDMDTKSDNFTSEI